MCILQELKRKALPVTGKNQGICPHRSNRRTYPFCLVVDSRIRNLPSACLPYTILNNTAGACLNYPEKMTYTFARGMMLRVSANAHAFSPVKLRLWSLRVRTVPFLTFIFKYLYGEKQHTQTHK